MVPSFVLIGDLKKEVLTASHTPAVTAVQYPSILPVAAPSSLAETSTKLLLKKVVQ